MFVGFEFLSIFILFVYSKIEEELNQLISEHSNSSITQQEPMDTLRGILRVRNRLNEFIQSLGLDIEDGNFRESNRGDC